MPSKSQPVFTAAPFHTTRWSRVCLAKAESEEGQLALADLCDAYYEPVVAYLLSVLGDSEAAREMSHAFFASLLAGGKIHTADPERGRFRFYLLGAVRHFVAHQRESDRRLRRGGGVRPLSLDADSEDSPALAVPDTTEVSPEVAFDRQWAVTVLERAMDQLHSECVAEGRSTLFEPLRPWLLGEAGHGDQAAIAETLGMSPGALKTAVSRMRNRFRQCVKTEVTGTLSDAGAVDDEMQSLFVALGG